MKTKKLVIVIMLLFAVSASAQTATEIPVSLKTTEGKYVGQVAGGGLDVVANAVTPKQTFVLVDLNGGKIADGDKILLRQDASQWREDSDKSMIHRVATKGAKENECTFKLRTKDNLIFFETTTGKFVRVNGAALVTTNEVGAATLFDVQAVVPQNAPVTYSVAFQTSGGAYVGVVSGGGLDASSKEISVKNVFEMVDLNGGGLTNGDSVKVISGQSQFWEDTANNRIHRVAIRGAKDAECTFKLLVVGTKVRIQAPSGKYVTVSADNRSVITNETADSAGLFTAIPNPTPTAK